LQETALIYRLGRKRGSQLISRNVRQKAAKHAAASNKNQSNPPYGENKGRHDKRNGETRLPNRGMMRHATLKKSYKKAKIERDATT
jgi:hypothetical protein